MLLIGALAGGPRARPAQAAPSAQANLLANGGLDSFAGNGMATSWEPWWEATSNPGTGSLDYAFQPSFAPENNPAFVQSGSGSQHIGRNWDPWHAGIRQTINVAPGSTVRITGYARAFASTPDFPSPSDSAVQSRMQIGAEPNGSIEWYAATVKWSGMANPHDTWAAFSLDVTAGANGKVTIFLSANYKGDSRYHLDAWWDNVSATVVGSQANTPAPGQTSAPPPATSGAQPTNPPPAATAFRMPTAGPDGNIIYIVQPGDTLWRIAAITGLTVDQLKALNGLSSDIISVGQRLIIGQGQASASPTATAGATQDPTAGPSVATSEPGADVTVAPTPAAAETQVAIATEAVGTGTVCAQIFNDANGNGVRDANEGKLPGGQLTVVDIATGAPLAVYTTDGINEPHCFTDLPEGQYTVSSATPGGYHATTNTATPLELTEGQTHVLEFGAQPSAAAADQPATRPANNQALVTAALFAGGVVFLLLAAGVAGFLFLRRR